MKKTYIEPMMIVEDFAVSDAIAAKNCKYTPGSIKLISQMTNFRTACAKVNTSDPVESMDYALFSDLYEGHFNTDGDMTPEGYPYFGDNGDVDDLFFTEEFALVSGANCYTDPFLPENADLVFGKNSMGNSCVMDTGSGGDTSLLQNS